MSKNNLINFGERIFVAGASGMVGSSVCRELFNRGYGNKANGGEIFAPSRNKLNLLDTEDVNNWFKVNKPTIVILAAAKVGGIYANSNYPADFIFENLKIQTNVIEASWRNAVKRLVFLGSSCIYPKFAEQPIKEESLLTGQLESTNEWYAIAKISGIKLCQALRKQYGFDAISLMPTNLYGTGDNYHPLNSHVVPALIRKFSEAVKYSKKEVICWGSGNSLREFMHVDDLSRAILFVLENWNNFNKEKTNDDDNFYKYIINIGSGQEISIKELAKIISRLTSFKGRIEWDISKPNGTPRKILDSRKIRDLGWEPLIELNDGIKKTIEEFIDNNQ